MVVVKRRSDRADAPVYTREDVQALVDKYNEPQWLTEFRLSAWDILRGHADAHNAG